MGGPPGRVWDQTVARERTGCTFFNNRGPVIGIPLLALLIQYYLSGLPPLRQMMPSFLILSAGQEPDMVLSLAATAAMGQPLPTLLPIAVTAGLTFVFLGIAIWKFQREEF